MKEEDQDEDEKASEVPQKKKKLKRPKGLPKLEKVEKKVKIYNRLRQYTVYETDVVKVIKHLNEHLIVKENDLPNIPWVRGGQFKNNHQMDPPQKAGPHGAQTLYALENGKMKLVVPREQQESYFRRQMLSKESTLPLSRDSGFHWLKQRTANISRRQWWKFLEKQGVLQMTRNIPIERKKGGAVRPWRGHCEMDLMHLNKELLQKINPRIRREARQEQFKEEVKMTKPAYFLALIEQLTGFGLVAFCPDKRVFTIRQKLKPLLKRMTKALGTHVLSLASDRGSEFSTGVTDLLNKWDPPIKQRFVARASRVEKYNSDFQRSFYRLVRLKRGGLISCSEQAETLTNNLLNKYLKMTPAEALKKPDAEIRPAYKASREQAKPYHIKKPVKIGDSCRYLVKMRKNIRKLGFKTYKAEHFSTKLFLVKNITKKVPFQFYVNGKWRDRDEIQIVSGTDTITDELLASRDF